MPYRVHVSYPVIVGVLLAGLLLVPHAVPAETHHAIKVGVIPQQSAKKIRVDWMPLVTYLQAESGYPVTLRLAPDIPTFEKRLFSGQYDLVYINPKLYVEAHRRVGYNAIAKEQNKKLVGIIVVAHDSKMKSLSDLDGMRIAFPKRAFAASIITRLNLEKQGINYTPQFFATHDHGYAMVANGTLVAAGGVLRTFNKLNDRIRNRLRILWRSPGMTPHAFAVHPVMDKVVAQRLQDALLSFSFSTDNNHNGPGFNPLEKADDSDWDDIRKLIGE